MALDIWTKHSGTNLGTFQERTELHLRLPVDIHQTGVTYTVISGDLPGNCRISGNYIIGIPSEVPRTTTFKFCIRANANGEIADRTFFITIEGADNPIFTTLADSTSRYLDIGINHQYFVMDGTEVDYQLEAYDNDTATGQKLSYFIASGDGELPLGLSLSQYGRITGMIEPVFSLTAADGDGSYDDAPYDSVAYDFAISSNTGYDTYTYDYFGYDYSVPIVPPKKLNRNYEFSVTITDGDSSTKKTFRIFVVGDDYFRADNTQLFNENGLFTADVSYMQRPIWLTKSNLGSYRANNYVTILLDVYDTHQVTYSIDDVANLPPGMSFDPISGDIYGTVPFQTALTKAYTFTVTATRHDNKTEIAESSRTFTLTIIGEIDSVISWSTPSYLGYMYANTPSSLSISATSTDPLAILTYTISAGSLPNGLILASNGDITGTPNQYSNQAPNNIGLISFDHVAGNETTFDQASTTYDRIFKFTVKASDQHAYIESFKEFTVLINTYGLVAFSNIKVSPLLDLEKRKIWQNFINDKAIFTPSSIYRATDPTYGMQNKLSMVVYAGIETRSAAEYISAMGLNHKRKRFHFGNVKKAYAKHPDTDEVMYEVVYIEMQDPLETNGAKLAQSIKTSSPAYPSITVDSSNDFWSTPITPNAPFSNRPSHQITVDSTGFQSSNTNPSTYYPNSISNWRTRIKSVGITERNFLPLWMRTRQNDTKMELGFVLAIPLCYCLPNKADDILLNIKHSGFNFNKIDYTIDRYIIDAVTGDSTDKYLLFKNERITI